MAACASCQSVASAISPETLHYWTTVAPGIRSDSVVSCHRIPSYVVGSLLKRQSSIDETVPTFLLQFLSFDSTSITWSTDRYQALHLGVQWTSYLIFCSYECAARREFFDVLHNVSGCRLDTGVSAIEPGLIPLTDSNLISTELPTRH